MSTAFSKLDNVVLRNLLLQTRRQDINALCRTNKLAAKICRNPEFRVIYNKLHPFYQTATGRIYYPKLFVVHRAGIKTDRYVLKGTALSGNPKTAFVSETEAKKWGKARLMKDDRVSVTKTRPNSDGIPFYKTAGGKVYNPKPYVFSINENGKDRYILIGKEMSGKTKTIFVTETEAKKWGRCNPYESLNLFGKFKKLCDQFFSCKEKNTPTSKLNAGVIVKQPEGLEPPTTRLRVACSTN